MRTGSLLMMAIWLALGMVPASLGDIALAVRGEQAKYSIVVPAEASPSQRYAASELQTWTMRLTGVSLPVVTSTPGPAIEIVQTDSYGRDGFRLQATQAGNLVVFGGRCGVLYGVYEVLERFGGIGWFASWHTVVPEAESLRIPSDLDDTQRPAFDVRTPYWHDARKGDFAARLRCNGTLCQIEPRHGGRPYVVSEKLRVHTFAKLLPVEEYFERHPEYFSMVGGRRVSKNSQLCLSNPEVLAIVTSNVLSVMRSEPNARIFNVSQNDCLNFCECPRCKAIDDEEGTHAGTLVRFVNAIAEAVEKEFPENCIETLAYTYTTKPPKKTRVRRNVVPRLCTVHCDFARPIPDSLSADTRAFIGDIEGWAAQTDKLGIWDYVTNFNHYPHAFPNVYALQGNIRFFRDHHVVSLLEQGDYQGRHADMAELKLWLIAKWMWNPELPMNELLDRFFNGYYGKAAPFVRRYFDLLYSRERAYSSDPKKLLTLYETPDMSCMDLDALDEAVSLWKQAEAAVRDEPAVYAYNVRMGAFSTDYTRLARTSRLLWATQRPELYGLHGDPRELASGLLEKMKEAGDLRVAEKQWRHDAFVRRLKAMVDSPDASRATALADCFKVRLGKIVESSRFPDGCAWQFDTADWNWSGTFALNRLAYDPGEKYVLRLKVHARRDANAPRGDVFRAGIYNPVSKKPLCHDLVVGSTEIADDWTWCQTEPFVPEDDAYVWCAPAKFDKGAFRENPAVRELFLNRIEFVKAKDQTSLAQ